MSMAQTNWRNHIMGVLWFSTTISMLIGSRPVRGATSCNLGETVYMTNPKVAAIEGPGDITLEQVHWSALEYSGLRGELEIGLGQRTFKLERLP